VLTNDVIQIGGLAQGVFTNEAAREAAITSPTEGMIAYLTAATVPTATGAITAIPTGIRTVYNGSVWVCITPVGASSNTPATTTSTSYVTTLTGDSVEISATLTTGTTALVSIFSRGGVNVADTPLIMSYKINAAAASDSNLLIFYPGGNNFTGTLGRTEIFTGLTAGTNKITLAYRVDGNTGSFTNRQLVVQGIA